MGEIGVCKSCGGAGEVYVSYEAWTRDLVACPACKGSGLEPLGSRTSSTRDPIRLAIEGVRKAALKPRSASPEK